MSAAAKEQKRANQLFRALMDKERTHVRIGEGRGNQTEVRLIGTVAELHGPDGCCVCCHGRVS